MLTVEAFHMKFFSGIRVMFNWRRFFAENWPITMMTLTSQHALSSLRLPWYRNGHGAFASYNEKSASPVTLDDIHEWYRLLSAEDVATIEKIRGDYLQGMSVPRFEFPSYALPGNGYMVLDANHRLCALALAQIPFSLNMWVVEGPIDPTALADTMFLCSTQL